jgi:hypothetical protein
MQWPPRFWAQRKRAGLLARPSTGSALLAVVMFMAGVCGPLPAQAFEIIPLYTHQRYFALDGCCQSASPREGWAGILRLELEPLGMWDLYGMSDRKWSEAALLRPQYLMGAPIKYDPSLDGITRTRRVQRYSLLWSYGVGFFSHNTRTVKFDLATLVSGLTVLSHLELQYSINDQFSLLVIGRAGAALSLDDSGLVLSPMIGFLWRM